MPSFFAAFAVTSYWKLDPREKLGISLGFFFGGKKMETTAETFVECIDYVLKNDEELKNLFLECFEEGE